MQQRVHARREEASSAPTISPVWVAYTSQVMPRVLGTTELTALFFLNVFWVTNVTPLTTGGGAGLSYWLLAGCLFFIPCSLVMAELASLFPVEGGIYTWTYFALGSRWSFFVSLLAWLPGILSMTNSSVAVVSIIQALDANLLTETWQQGGVVGLVLLFVGWFSCQRTRLVLLVLLWATIGMGLATLLALFAALVWLLSGQPSMTPLLDVRSFAPGPANFALLGSATLALMGSNMPLSMAGEARDRTVLSHHLFWGTLLTLGGYLSLTLVLLLLAGAEKAATTLNPMLLLVGGIERVFGTVPGNVMALLLMLYFVLIPVALNLCLARLPLVASLDGQISRWFASLNRDRVPTHSLLFQTALALFFTVVIYFLVPLLSQSGAQSDVSSIAYNVLGAGLLLVWAVSFLFPFLDVLILWLGKHPIWMQHTQVIPVWLLLPSALCGTLFCVLVMVNTLMNSFLPTLIPNSSWWWVIGSVALISMMVCGIGCFLTTSQAAFEKLVSTTSQQPS